MSAPCIILENSVSLDYVASLPQANATNGHLNCGAIRPHTRPALWFALGATLLLAACTAPGMKLNQRPTNPTTTTDLQGLKVTLRPLSAEVMKAQTARGFDPGALRELLSETVPPYRVGPQDILLATVWDHPEITLPLGANRTDSTSGNVVDEAGYLYFPYIGRFLVKGLTITEVRDVLAMQLGKLLRNPQVDIKVIAYRSQKIYIGGEVRNPAVYTVTDVPFTLAEAINRAGGFLPGADDSRLLLTRGDRTWKLDFQALMASGNRIGQILLKDGDTLQIPGNMEEPVYIMGELARPGILPLVHGNLSLARAMSEAGGIQGTTADTRSIYVIRQASAANTVDVFHLDARHPAAMVLADRFPLKPRDIVYVDAGTLVRWNRVMSLILPTFSAITGTASDIKYLVK
jgi:polysaccharide biosynthesis/export protein